MASVLANKEQFVFLLPFSCCLCYNRYVKKVPVKTKTKWCESHVEDLDNR